jgi:hypothetical protein
MNDINNISFFGTSDYHCCSIANLRVNANYINATLFFCTWLKIKHHHLKIWRSCPNNCSLRKRSRVRISHRTNICVHVSLYSVWVFSMYMFVFTKKMYLSKYLCLIIHYLKLVTLTLQMFTLEFEFVNYLELLDYIRCLVDTDFFSSI